MRIFYVFQLNQTKNDQKLFGNRLRVPFRKTNWFRLLSWRNILFMTEYMEVDGKV